MHYDLFNLKNTLMKKSNYFLCLVAASALFAACSNKESGGNGITPGEGTAGITISLRGAGDTRADNGTDPGIPAEQQIDRLELYVYNSSTGQPDTVQPVFIDDSYDNGNVNFLVAPGSKKVLAIVNVDVADMLDITPDELKTYTYDEMKELVTHYVFEDENDPREAQNRESDKYNLGHGNSRVIRDGFVMSGESTVNVIENIATNYVEIVVSRIKSKVEAPVMSPTLAVSLSDAQVRKAFGFGESVVVDGQLGFDFTGYALINGLTTSDILPNWNAGNDEKASWTGWTRKGTHLPKIVEASRDLLLAYSGQKDGSWWLSGTTDDTKVVYVYENEPIPANDGDIAGFEKESVYALLVRGNLKYTPADGGDVKTAQRYWRINLIRDDEYKIFRNSVYTVTVNAIKTPGYGTAEDAIDDNDNGTIVPGNNQTGILAEIKVAPWRLRTQSTDM